MTRHSVSFSGGVNDSIFTFLWDMLVIKEFQRIGRIVFLLMPSRSIFLHLDKMGCYCQCLIWK